jgi:GNAT superfamily N-acetyltransferase
VSQRETKSGILPYSDLRAIGIDDLSAVRYVHASALRSAASAFHAPEEMDAMQSEVYSSVYAADLLSRVVFGAFTGGQLIGTAGWCAANDAGETARVTDVYVHPLFMRSGIGRRLVARIEVEAGRAGFRELSVRSTTNAAAFFGKLGYDVASHGVRSTMTGIEVPVIFMRKRTLRTDRPSGRGEEQRSRSGDASAQDAPADARGLS